MIKLRLLITLLFVFGSTSCMLAQDSPPSIIALGNQNYCTNSFVPIVSSVSITDPDVSDNTLGTVSIQISVGYVFGADQLQLTGTHPTISSFWDANQGKLVLNGISGITGTATFAEFEAAIFDVIFFTTQTVFTEDRQISINLGGANFLPSTGHYYFYEQSLNITWTTARNAAAAQNYFGLQGYLATLTTNEEAQLSGEQATGTGWIGATDELNEGTWRWVTGPEGLENSGTGRPFWQGTFTGVPINGEYSKWNTNEPNQTGNEDYAHIVSPNLPNAIPGSWNDLPNVTQTSGNYQAKGYVVEFGGMPGDPIINLSASTTINTPRLNFSDIEGCGNQALTISLNTNIGGIEWYETATSSIVINTGDTYTTSFSQSTVLYVSSNFPGCASQNRLPLTVTIFDTPTAGLVTNQLICDDNNDGLWNFDLDALQPDVLGTQDIDQYSITFHENQVDADADANPIVSPYTNLVAYQQQTIVARIENDDSTNCYATSDFIIDVFDQPLPLAYTYELCDDTSDSDDTNGFVNFPLTPTDIDSFVLNGQDPLQFTVTYHLNQSDADNDSGAITNLYTDDTQIIARVENNDNILCYDTVFVDLQVNALPIITTAVSLLQCDTDTDGISDFNLTESEILISNNFAAETFTYHMSFADADTGNNPIPNFLAFPNTDPSSNPDTLFVRTENADGCHRVAQLDLFVSTTSIPPGFMINTYQECDDTRVDANITDGITTFDFSDATPLIVGLFPPGQIITVTYYETTADALAEINAIPDISNHINTASPFNQTITYRIDSDVDNSCLGIGEFELETINPMPNLNPDPIILCDDITVGDLVETFDLTQQETFIFNGETNVSATYHLDYDQAVAGSNAIVTPAAYNNTGPSETIYIRVTNTDNCFAIVELNIQVNPLPDDSAVVTDYFECENNTDFFFDFDLETKTPEVLNGQDPTQFTVTYHDTELDADNLTNPLASPYTNIISPQPIFVAITNNTTGCSISTITFNIEINEGAIALDDFYEECDVVNDNDGFTQFDLESRSPIVMDGADPIAFSISYHFSFSDAFNDVDPLPLLYENFTNPQIIYARVSNVIRPTECFAISEVTLQVNLLPIFDLDDEYILCLTSNNEAVVDVPPILDTGLSDADYAFEWRLDGVVLPTETSSSLIPVQGGTYEVTVTDTSTSTVTMCQNFDSTEVIESGIPDTFTVEVTSLAFSGNNMIIVTATGNSTYEYSLDNGPWQLDTDFENVTGGQHTVYARDILGCGIISEMVTVIDYPKFFTPNGDGNNDTWNIRGINTQPAAVIYIYDRYGKLLKQLSPTSPGWDGTFNGNRMPSSDYWFTLEYFEPIANETRTFTAHFSLKR